LAAMAPPARAAVTVAMVSVFRMAATIANRRPAESQARASSGSAES
jgi:hypothetical protein